MQKEGQWQALDVLQQQHTTLNKGVVCISAFLLMTTLILARLSNPVLHQRPYVQGRLIFCRLR